MRNLKITSIIICLSLILFQFQNCSSPPSGSESSSSSDGAGLIDDLPNQKLAFVESLVITKHDKDLINYDGLCSADSHDKEVEWVLEDVSSREVILEGATVCSLGGFRISIDTMLDVDCNKEYELIPFIGEFEDRVIIKRKCDPISVIEVDETVFQAVKNNPNIAKEACFYELDKMNTTANGCFKVCYLADKLYSRDQIETNMCSY